MQLASPFSDVSVDADCKPESGQISKGGKKEGEKGRREGRRREGRGEGEGEDSNTIKTSANDDYMGKGKGQGKDLQH